MRDNPELQKHSLSTMYQKRRVKREYAKAYREAHKNGRRGAAAVKKAKEAVGNIGHAAVTVIKSNKGVLLLVGGIALLLIMVFFFPVLLFRDNGGSDGGRVRHFLYFRRS